MRFLLHPVILFFTGSFIGLSPHFLGGEYFDVYKSFVSNETIVLVYCLGMLFFLLGSILCNLFFFTGTPNNKYCLVLKPKIKDLNIFITVLLALSFLLFLKIISLYGSIPVLSIISGGSSISHVNETQKLTGGGLYGIFSVFIFSLIILFPYSVMYKNNSRFSFKLFLVHLSLLVIYTTYSGKRQMIFIFITFVCSYLYIYHWKNNNYQEIRKIKKYSFFFICFAIFFFLLIGGIRNNFSGDVSFFEPIIHYASLPYMNLTNIISNQESNYYSYTMLALYETNFAFIPNLFKDFLISDPKSLVMPLIEKTSPTTVYGIVFWNFGYIGVSSYLFVIGFWSNYLYRKALYCRSDLFIGLYAFTIWPLLSVHTYNHFINFTFYIVPLLLIVIGNLVYNSLPKKQF